MEENNQGKRVAPTPGKRKTAVIIAALVALLLLGYLGVCGYVDATGKIMPNTTASQVELGGLTRAQAAEKLRTTLSVRYDNTAVTFAYDTSDGRATARVPSDWVGTDVDAVVEESYHCGRERGFLLQGLGFFQGLAGGYRVEAPLRFTKEADINVLIDGAAEEIDQPMVDTTYSLTETDLLLQKGEPGLTVDREALKARILSAFEDGQAHPAGEDHGFDEATFYVSPDQTFPAEPDLEGLYHKIHAEVKNAEYDPQTYEITPHVVGVSFDVEAAREQYAHTGWGSVCELPLVLTQPEMTTEELDAILFRDTLGACTTSVGGTNNRASNVALAASFCNGIIILPGEEFSYNTVVGSRTKERGFLPAPAYVKGETVDEIGGGICQVSSTIYLTSLRSNMAILERQNHSYAVGYVPDGMDATVYFGSLDFRFQNNTAYPVKMVVTMQNRKLTVELVGTKVDDVTVKMESVRLSTTPYDTIYQIDNSISQGSSKISVTPYTGRKVEVYRCLYDGSGKLISRTLENVSNYRKRDRIILINSADAATYGVDAVTGVPLPAMEPTPVPSLEPSPTPSDNSGTVTPDDPMAEPTATASPSTEPIASPTVGPDTPVETQPPVQTEGVDNTAAPENGEDPAPTASATPTDGEGGNTEDIPLITPYL